MWLLFTACVVFALVTLYLPGSLLLAVSGVSFLRSICWAPVVSIAVFAIFELVLIGLGVAVNVQLLFGLYGLLIVIGLLIKGFLLKRHHHDGDASLCRTPVGSWKDNWLVTLYLCVGILAVFFFFIKQLDGADSFFQGWDNVTHLNGIRALTNSMEWNPLSLGVFTLDDVTPFKEFAPGFYPSAMHILCASICSVTGADPMVSLNAVNAVVIGIVFPLGFYQLLHTLTKGDRAIVLAGSLLCLGNAVAPWDMLIYGPLFPNLFSFSLIPIVMSCFIVFCEEVTNNSGYLVAREFAITILGAIAVFLGHPNGIFSLIVLLAPYLFDWGYAELRRRGVSLVPRAVVMACLALVIIVFWMIFYRHPLFSGVVGVSWPSINNSFLGAAADSILYSYVWRPENLLMALLTLIGFIVALQTASSRWLALSMAASQVLYAVAAGTDGEFKQVLTGFWYTDYYRLAAIAAFASSVVACFGLGMLARSVINRVRRLLLQYYDGLGFVSKCAHGISIGMYILLGILLFNGHITLLCIGSIEMPIGYQAAETERQYNKELVHYDVLTSEEYDFVKSILSYIDDGSTVINMPNDGSLFLYATDNVKTYYRSGYVPSDEAESEDSRLIRTRLFDIASDHRVRAAVQHTGAKYVLLLDAGDRPEETRIYYNSYFEDDWAGIQLIDNDTPGFTLVSQCNDMRLYKIDDIPVQ